MGGGRGWGWSEVCFGWGGVGWGGVGGWGVILGWFEFFFKVEFSVFFIFGKWCFGVDG